MKYMGSKRKIANDILQIILKDRKDNQCGGCNVIDKVEGKRIANDYNEYVYAMWEALVNKDWIPPTQVTELEYKNIKNNQDKYNKELVGFVGVCLSFGASWFNGYSKNKRGTNYAMEGRKNLLEQVKRLKGVVFNNCSYDELDIPSNSLIYCDPPYQDSKKYKDCFDNDKFWQWCRDMTNKGHQVFISEYKAPDDFTCVWEKDFKTLLNANKEKKTIERLFVFK